MAILELRSMIVPEISVKNNLEDNAKLELESNVSAKNAEFDASTNLFKVTYFVTVSDKSRKLYINIGIRGSFIVRYGETETKQINLDLWGKKSFAMVYPYIRATLSSVMSDAMLAPIYLPPLQCEIKI